MKQSTKELIQAAITGVIVGCVFYVGLVIGVS